MNWLMDFVPAWVPLAVLAFMIIALIVSKFAYPEDAAAESSNPENAVTVATLTFVVDTESGDIGDPDVQWTGRVLRNKLDEYLHYTPEETPRVWREPQVRGRLWLESPRVRFVGVRKGSLLFDYDIYILVTGSAIAVLKNYSSLKTGLKDLLEDTEKLRRNVASALRRLRRPTLRECNLRILTEEELSESLARFRTKEVMHEHVTVSARRFD